VPPVLDYTGFRQGALLTSGGAVVSTQVFESAPGNLVVGVSRVGGVAGVDGSGVLVVLELQAVAAGSGSFTFSNQAGFDADGGQLPLSWSTGSVTVVR
jgi:hypothetical protein